ncbi:hypothetical protein JW835_04465 [bacterium]|nr:hypothetical protein [bacterium]
MNLINDFAHGWWQWMGSMFWQVGLLIAIISGIDFLIRKWAWPQIRYGLWLVVLLKLLLPPSCSSPVSLISRAQPQIHENINKTLLLDQIGREQWPVADSDHSADTPVTDNPVAGNPVLTENPQELKSPSRVSKTETALSWQSISLIVWLTGIVIFSIILLLKMSLLRHWHDQQQEKSIPSWFHEMLVETASAFQINHLPAIVFHNQVKTPAVYGLFKPVMLLPTDYFKQLTKNDARHVLLHELAHLKRGDLWMHGLCLFLQIMYWFNPLLIWVRRQMKMIREICCDLTVANVLKEDTMAYRQTLLNTAREMLTENMSPGLGLLGVFEDPFRLIPRLKWLEKNTWKRRNLILITSLLISLTISAAIVPMAAMKPVKMLSRGSVSTEFSIGEPVTINPDSVELHIKLKKVDDLYAAVLPMCGLSTSQDQTAAIILQKLLTEQKIKPKGSLFARFFSDPEQVPPEKHIWEIGVPVKPGTRVKEPLKTIRINKMQVATASLTGMKGTEAIWNRFIQQIQDEGLVPCFPHAYEIYKAPPENKPFWWHTEMQLQAFRPDKGYPGLNISYKKSDPKTAVILPVYGDYYKHAKVLEQLNNYLKTNNIKTAGPAFGLYYTPETETHRDHLYWEIGIPVKEAVKVEAPYELRQIESHLVASACFQGPFNMEHPWSPFLMQLILDGYLPVNPGVEIWKDHGRNSTTELQIGVIRLGDTGNLIQNLTEDIVKSVTGTARSKNVADDKKQMGIYALEKIHPQWMIIQRMKGSYEQAPVIFSKLDDYCKAVGIQKAGDPVIRQYNNADITPVYELLWDAGYVIKEKVNVAAPFEVIQVPEKEIIRHKVKQGHDTHHMAQQLSAWFLHYNYRPGVPTHIVWTHGLFSVDNPQPPLEVWQEVLPMDPPYEPVNLEYCHESSSKKALLLPMKGSRSKELEAIRQVQAYVRKNKIVTTGSPFIRYLENDEIVPEEKMRWQAGVILDNDTKIQISDPYMIEWFSGGAFCSERIESDQLELETNQWLAFVLNFTMNGYTAKGYPIKIVHQSKQKPYDLELCWTVDCQTR